MKCFSRAATVMAAIALFWATTASATIVVETNGDNRMRNSTPTGNWGTLTSMDLVPPGNNTTHGLVAFDNLPALTGAQVASATLRLQAWLGTGHTIEARAVGPLGDPNDPNDGWTELGSSWNNYKPGWAWPNGPGGLGDAPVVADSLTITAIDTLYDWDVTTEVKAWLDGNAENNGFLLNAVPGTNTGSDNRLATREGAVDGLQPPRLIIEVQECDFDGGGCGLSDINLMMAQGDLTGAGVGVGAGNQFDLNADNTINEADITVWLSLTGTTNGYTSPMLRGDTDNVGASSPTSRTVDITDFQNFLGGFTGAGSTWEVGNFNGDNVVDITDFSNHFLPNFAATGGGTYGPGKSIPEPSTVLLLGLGGALLACVFSREFLATQI